MTPDVAIVGAGVSGLACARALAAAGHRPVVFERSRGVGGRCATRRILDQPVDHGASFLHGVDEEFLAEAAAVDGTEIVQGWPREVAGDGPPCAPRAFHARERRWAYASGVSLYPKTLARGLDIRLRTDVVAIGDDRGGAAVVAAGGGRTRFSTVVLALPADAARGLLEPHRSGSRDLRGVTALLRLVGSQACLTAICGYPGVERTPPWEVCYPADSTFVQMISHDSSKRRRARFTVLVVQGKPCWSRARLGDPESSWGAEMIAETARIVGAWAGAPAWTEYHRWRFARSDRGSELSSPVRVQLPGGGRLHLTGEAFAPGGGVEAAWTAGRAAARRVMEES